MKTFFVHLLKQAGAIWCLVLLAPLVAMASLGFNTEPDNTWRAVASSASVLCLIAGLCFLFFHSRREFLNRLKEQQLQAEFVLQKEKAALNRQVAQDIRGPLLALTTLSQLSHEMTEEKKELLNLVVSRIRGISEDLLAKSQGSSPKTEEPKNESTDLLLMSEKILKEYRFSHPHIQFVLNSHVEASKVILENLSEVHMQRILSNILNNSIAAAPEKEARIDLSILEREDRWLVQIKDNGVGIPEEVLPRLFDENSTDGKANAHSLFEARKTLRAIGGDLQIRSRLAEGTQVLLILPKAQRAMPRSS
ncbi:MAG TPA: HAMP domain-containing sensor histidine kinase [Bdellovibrio sp.]|nr:HAMP domain-containing sensor histidine kinase [Bdellovibrio sp.]